jgi:hypothetical protein
MSGSTIEIRPYTTKQLAALYCVSTNTFCKWINRHKKSIGKKLGHFYSIQQVLVIFEKLGYPIAFKDDSA